MNGNKEVSEMVTALKGVATTEDDYQTCIILRKMALFSMSAYNSTPLFKSAATDGRMSWRIIA